jgi:glycosyltransferase involved in cell wall biosynthesis
VPLAVADAFKPASEDQVAQVRRTYNLQRPFILWAGTLDPRKRADRLAQVAKQVQEHAGIDLVISGDQGKFDAPVRHELERAGITQTTHMLGHIPLPDLIALYGACHCLVFPSEYEGFGLPPLEAMACGAPVALFDNSSLSEIAGEVALRFPDGDTTAMAAAISGLYDDQHLVQQLREAGIAWAKTFTWRKTASATLAVYHQILARA